MKKVLSILLISMILGLSGCSANKEIYDNFKDAGYSEARDDYTDNNFLVACKLDPETNDLIKNVKWFNPKDNMVEFAILVEFKNSEDILPFVEDEENAYLYHFINTLSITFSSAPDCLIRDNILLLPYSQAYRIDSMQEMIDIFNE